MPPTAKSKSAKPLRRGQRASTTSQGDYGVMPQEDGAIRKDWGGRIAVALTMPNTYYVGMSSLALQLLYRTFNQEDDVVCDRIFWE